MKLGTGSGRRLTAKRAKVSGPVERQRAPLRSALCRLALAAVGAAVLGSGAPGSLGAEVRGRVVEAGTERSVSWATVSLDAQPPDGSAEYTTRTDLFGMFVLDNVAPDAYRITVEHAAYEPSLGEVSLETENARSTMTFSLTGVDQETRITLYFGVSCVQTYAGLPDASITVVRWDQYGARAAPDEIKYVHTAATGDHIGQAVLPGMKTGDFRFTVFRSGWEVLTIPPTDQDPIRLTTDYTVSAALKPIHQDLHVQVKGDDPKTGGADQVLGGVMLELTGLDFSETDDLIEPRTALTDENGQAIFRNLPQIPWRVRAFSPGYSDAEQIARAGNAGYSPVNISLSLRQTAIEVELHTPLYAMELTQYAQVRLTGITDSATAGIDRTNSAVADPNARGRIRARFTNIVPGRYMVRIAHSRFVLPPIYPGLGYSTPEPSHGYGYQAAIRFEPVRRFIEVEVDETAVISVDLNPLPAVITGVLLAGEKPDWDAERVFIEKMQTGIEFVQPNGETILKPGFAAKSVDTDAAGRFSIELPPGVYGIRIPGLHDYTGFGMRLINPDTGEGIIDEYTQSADRGWPYAETDNYPYVVAWYPRQIDGPLLLQSGDRYEIVLRIHKKQATVAVPVNGVRSPLYHALISVDPASQTYQTAQIVDLQGSTTLTRAGDGLQFVHQYTREEGFEEPGAFSGFAAFFADVPPGAYDIDIQLDHFSPGQSTVTVPEWGDPGYFPTDPFFQTTWITPGDVVNPENTPNPNWINLTTLSPGPIQVTDYEWDEYYGKYNKWGTATYGGLVKRGHDDADGNLVYQIGVNGANTNNSVSGAPDGAYTFWWPGPDGKWFRVRAAPGETAFTFYHGGPRDTSSAQYLPPPFQTGLSYEARISTVSTADPNYLIGGITVPLPDGSTPPQFTSSGSGPTTVQMKAAPNTDTFSGVQTTQWLHYWPDKWSLVSADPIVFDVRVHFKRGMQISGRIVQAAARTVIPHARITIYSRRGTELLTGISDDQGRFTLGAVDTQAVYVEVRAAGHLPFRKRYLPGPQNAPDIAAGDIALEPVPPPTLQTLTLDRFGLFLPGVLKSGDASAYNVDNADSALTAAWQAVVQPASLSFTLEGFDDDQGAPQLRTFQVVDPVRNIWLVDKRWYEALPAESPTASANPLSAPSPLTVSTVRELMTDVRATTKDGSPFYVVYNSGRRVNAPRTGRQRAPSPVTYQGSLKLYELPAGRFLPMVLVVTERGAVAAKDYLVPDGRKPLQGLQLPKWSATFLEVIGIASTFAPDVDPSKVTPQGRFVPLPDFDSGIDVNPTGYLTYTYQLGLAWTEGVKAPTSGILSAASKNMGLSFKATARFQVTGEDGKTALSVGGAVTKDSKEAFEKYYPAFAKAAGFTVHSASVTGAARLGVAEFTDNTSSSVPDYTYTSTASAFVKARFYRDMTPFLEKVPTVGPVLGGLGRSGALVVNGVVDLGIGGGVTITSSTFYPNLAVHTGTVLPLPGLTQPARWHVLGGMGDGAHEIADPAKFNLQLLVGVGANVSMFGDRLSGTATVQLGPPKDIPSQKGLKFTVNPRLEWPVITRVQGAFNVVLEMAVRIWGLKVSRSFNLFDRRIDWQLAAGSGRAGEIEPYYDLVPLYTTEVIQRPGLSPPPVLHASGDTLLEGLDGPGLFDIAPDGTLLVYVGSAPGDSGTVRVLAARKALDGSWDTPAVVAEGAAMLGVAVAPNPGGGWLVVWTELVADQVGSAFPETMVRYAVSGAARSGWSPPTTLTTVQAAAWDPRLVPAGNGTLLAWLNTTGGPLSGRHLGMSAWWDGVAWTVGPLPIQAAETDISDLAVCGTTDATVVNPALTAWSDGQGNIFVQQWTGSGWTQQTTVVSDAGKQLAGAFPFDGGVPPVLAYMSNRDSMVFVALTGTRDATPLAEIPDITAVEDLTLRATAATTYTAVWSRGGGTHSALFFATIASDGTLLAGPVRASADGAGRLGNIRVEPATDRAGSTVLVEVLANGRASVLRYHLDPAAPVGGGPVVLAQPQDVLATRGSIVRVKVRFSGIGSVGVDWLHDDRRVDNSGGNSPFLEIADVQSDDEGLYKAVLSDATGMTTSDAATLTVTDSLVFQIEPGWNLLGLPAVPDRALADILKTADGTLLTEGPAWAWDAAARTYTVLPPEAPPPAGAGFWVYSRHGGATAPFDAAVRRTIRPPSRSLPAGWNLLSPPATGPTPGTWPDGGQVWKWRGNKYSPVDPAAPNTVFLLEAYWVYVTP